MDKDDVEQQFQAWNAIREARTAITLAKQRVESVDELCARLTTTASPDELGRVAYALLERAGEERHQATIIEALHRVSRETERRHSRERERLDRSTGRILRALPTNLAMPLAMEWGGHHTKRRRSWAFKVFRQAPLDDVLLSYLQTRFQETKDTEFAKLLLRAPLPTNMNRSVLFEAFEEIGEPYWQARVAESALRSDPQIAEKLSFEQPHAFVWAVGRLELKEQAGMVFAAIQRANDKVPLVGIVVWALGKLGAKRELLELEPLIDALELAYPDPFRNGTPTSPSFEEEPTR